MSATIFAAPNEIKVPDLDFTNFGNYRKKCDEYIKELRDFILECNDTDDDCIGEVIRFPVADGYAKYMVASLKPTVELVHIPLDDAYEFAHVDLMTEQRVRELVKTQKG